MFSFLFYDRAVESASCPETRVLKQIFVPGQESPGIGNVRRKFSSWYGGWHQHTGTADHLMSQTQALVVWCSGRPRKTKRLVFCQHLQPESEEGTLSREGTFQSSSNPFALTFLCASLSLRLESLLTECRKAEPHRHTKVHCETYRFKLQEHIMQS